MATASARTKTITQPSWPTRRIWRKSFAAIPLVTLKTSGRDVGLPAGQMGNSEVGHLNIGAGRIVYQDITRIDRAIEDGDYFKSPELNALLDDLERRGRALHIMGLVSNGGVHSSLEHLRATLELCHRRNFTRVVLHAFTDGRDTPPHVRARLSSASWKRGSLEFGVGRIQTVSGRYYAMDRDKRWDRVEKAYRAICLAEGNHAPTAAAAVEASYAAAVTDEFILPTVIDSPGGPQPLSGGDGVFFFNFRADRTRQLTDALTDPDFDAVRHTGQGNTFRHHDALPRGLRFSRRLAAAKADQHSRADGRRGRTEAACASPKRKSIRTSLSFSMGRGNAVPE